MFSKYPHILSTLKNKQKYAAFQRKQSYYQYKYNNKIEELINRQIQTEQQTAQDYLSMAVNFLHPSVSQPGAGGFFMLMYEEEISHMQNFIQYQLLRGGLPVLSGLKAPRHTQDVKLLEAFNQALCMEKNVTELLEEVVCVAEEVKDYQCADFIVSTFLKEQMRSILEISNHITKLTRLGDNVHGIYHYDLQLAKDYPYSYQRK